MQRVMATTQSINHDHTSECCGEATGSCCNSVSVSCVLLLLPIVMPRIQV